MIVKYSSEADALTIKLSDNPRHRAVNVSDAMNVTLDERGCPITIELLALSQYTDTPEVDFIALPGSGYITLERVMEMKDVSRRTVERYLKDGAFEGAIQLGKERGQWWIPYEAAEAWEPKPVGRPKKEPT